MLIRSNFAPKSVRNFQGAATFMPEAAGRRRRDSFKAKTEEGQGRVRMVRWEPSYHLSASLAPNSALAIDTEAPRDFFAPAPSGARWPFPCSLRSSVANTSTYPTSPLAASHHSPDQDPMWSAIARTIDFQARLWRTQAGQIQAFIPSPPLNYPRKVRGNDLLGSYAPSRAQA